MLVTEEEAKTKACPRTIMQEIVDNEGDLRRTCATHCAGSACMAWRWEQQTTAHQEMGRGFCGLAGNVD